MSGPSSDRDIRSLQHTLLFGLKGISAYAEHAAILGQKDDAIPAFIHEALAAIARNDAAMGVNEWVGLVLKCGEVNLRTMEVLDAANTGATANPVPTQRAPRHEERPGDPRLRPRPEGPRRAAQADEGKGIYVYTHGEMLPTHGYPEIEEVSPFLRPFRTAWQNQMKEFPDVPRRDPAHHELPDARPAGISGQHLHAGPVGWPGVAAPREQGFHRLDPEGARYAGLHRRQERQVRNDRLRAEDGNGRSRQGDRGGQGQADPPLLPRRRLRRREAGAQLLYGVRREGAEGLRSPHARLRQVPLLRQGPGRYRRHPAGCST